MPTANDLRSGNQLAGEVTVDVTQWIANLAKAQAAFEQMANKIGEIGKRIPNAIPSKPLDVVAQAFNDLGVKSQAALQKTAQDAQKAFDTIKNSGTASIADISRAWEAKQSIIDSTVGSWTNSLNRFGEGLSATGQRMTAFITLPILAAGGAAIKLASDFDESMNKTKVVFGSAGASVVEFSKTSATNLGLSQQKTLEAAASFGNLFTTMKLGQQPAADMSIRLTKLASDMASIHNIRPEDALEKLRAGLIGEAEPLRSTGILLSDVAVKSKALELGFKAVGGQFTEQQKVMARYNIILDQSKNATGDFINTSGGMANSSRILSGLMEDLGKDIGQVLLPFAVKLAASLKDLLGWFNSLSPSTKEWLVMIGGAAAVAGPTVFVLGKLVSAIADTWRAMAKMVEITPALITSLKSTDLALLATRAGWLALAAGAVFAVVELNKQYREAGSITKMIANSLNVVTDAVENARRKMGEITVDTPLAAQNWTKESEEIQNALQNLTAKVKKVKEELDKNSPLISERAFAGSTESIEKAIKNIGLRMGDSLNDVRDDVGEKFASWWQSITVQVSKETGIGKDIFADVPSRIAEHLDKTKEGVSQSLSEIRSILDAQGAGFAQSLEKSIALALAAEVGLTKEALTTLKFHNKSAFDEITKILDAASSEIATRMREVRATAELEASKFRIAVHQAFDDLRDGKITASQFGSVLRGEMAPAIQLVREKAEGLSTTITSLADRAEKSLKKFKDAFENNFKLQDLNLKANIFGAITSQLDHLAQVSGVDKDIVLQNFRDMLAGSVAAAGEGAAQLKEQIALIDQAILNSQLAKLEDTWGKPLGRAIEAILVYYNKLNVATGKLQTSMLAKVTALGELFAVLPGSIGKSINKVISIINTVVDVVSKALNVLVAFGVNLPGPIQKVLDILNKGAGSTTAVMKQMAEDVKAIMQDMAQQVIAIFKQMAEESKRQIDSMKQGAQSGASGITSNFVGGLSPLPGSVGGLLNQVGSIFGSWGQKITSVIQTVTGSIGGFGNQTSVVFSASILPVQLFATTFTSSMNQVAFSATAAAQQTTAAMGQMNAAAANGTSQLGKLAAGIGGALAGASMIANVYGSGMGRVKGALQGALGGATAGASIGFMVGGPVGAGIGALVGAGAGAILGIFGGGKNELQKAQFAAQLQSAKDAVKLSIEQVKQAGQATFQAVIKTGSDLADLIEKVGNTTFVPKEIINKFLKQGFSFLSKLADGMKDLAAKATPELKAAAENFGPVVALAAAIPDAFNAINGHWGIADAQFVIFFRDYDRLIDGFLTRAAEASKKAFKKAGKLAELITPAVSLIAPLVEGITGINDLKEPTEASLSVIDRSLDAIVTHLGALGQKFEKYYLKTLRFFAEQAQAGLAVWKDATDAIRATVDVPVPKESDVVNVVTGIRLFVEKLIAGVADLTTEGLSRAVEIAGAVSPIASAFKAWAESSEIISKYTEIGADKFNQVRDDFLRGLEFLGLLKIDAIEYKSLAMEIDEIITAGSDSLSHAMQTFGSSITDMSSALHGTIGNLQGGAQPGDGFGANSFSGGSSFAPSFAGSSLTPSLAGNSSAPVKQTVVNNYYTIGDVKIDKNDPRTSKIEKHVKALQELLTGFVDQEVQYS